MNYKETMRMRNKKKMRKIMYKKIKTYGKLWRPNMAWERNPC